MARGRFLTKTICLDKKVNDLKDPYSIIGFTWLITHADCEGRVFGDPAVVKSLLFPRKSEITLKMVEGYIKEWHKAGMIIWYEANGDKYIQFPNFEVHQKGLRKDREAPSIIPPYTSDKVRSKAGVKPEEIPVKLSKDKISKDKISKDKIKDDKKPTPFISEFLTAVRVQFTNYNQPSKIDDLVEDYGENVVLECATWYGQNNPRNMSHALKSINTALTRGWNQGSKKLKKKSAGKEFNPKDIK